jgi:hypothetical protein
MQLISMSEWQVGAEIMIHLQTLRLVLTLAHPDPLNHRPPVVSHCEHLVIWSVCSEGCQTVSTAYSADTRAATGVRKGVLGVLGGVNGRWAWQKSISIICGTGVLFARGGEGKDSLGVKGRTVSKHVPRAHKKDPRMVRNAASQRSV